MSERTPPTHLRYRQALRWLYAFSDTERTGAFVRDRGDNLRRERALLAELGDPQRAYGIIHIAGSKGKGSTSAMIASILTAAGMRTGLYTSPDLHTFRERIRVAGAPVSEEQMARLAETVREALERVDPSLGSYITWEVATALAFLAFRESGVERAVIEVGLGGRLDATNVVEPAVCAITSISYEHMEILGHTLTEIAREKAGIIKPGVPVVTSAREPEALAEITRIAVDRDAPLTRVGPEGAEDCSYTWREGAAGESFQRFRCRHPHWRLPRPRNPAARRASDRERDRRRRAGGDHPNARSRHDRRGRYPRRAADCALGGALAGGRARAVAGGGWRAQRRVVRRALRRAAPPLPIPPHHPRPGYDGR